jgi:hypothetical protein
MAAVLRRKFHPIDVINQWSASGLGSEFRTCQVQSRTCKLRRLKTCPEVFERCFSFRNKTELSSTFYIVYVKKKGSHARKLCSELSWCNLMYWMLWIPLQRGFVPCRFIFVGFCERQCLRPPAVDNTTQPQDTDQRGLCKHWSGNSPRVAGG